MIIDIEGVDGTGKATQTQMLYDYLISKGYSCILISFPNYSSLSSGPVKMYLGGDLGENADCLNGYQTSSLFAVDRLITLNRVDLSNYDFVLFDRYVPSNMIHQSTRIRDKKELDDFLFWVDDYEYNKLKLPRPDKIIFLDVPAEISFQLSKDRKTLKCGLQQDILERDKDYLLTAYERAKYVADKFNWIKIDCMDKGLKSKEEIHEDILTKLNLK